TKSSPTRPMLDLDPRAARGRPSTAGSGLLSSASCLLSPARLSSWPDLPWPTGFAATACRRDRAHRPNACPPGSRPLRPSPSSQHPAATVEEAWSPPDDATGGDDPPLAAGSVHDRHCSPDLPFVPLSGWVFPPSDLHAAARHRRRWVWPARICRLITIGMLPCHCRMGRRQSRRPSLAAATPSAGGYLGKMMEHQISVLRR
ncbi:hypothetical protein ACLOJK_004541, partial [Asimina triloba]